MGSMTISCIVFACIFGGTLLGMLLRAFLPEKHLNAESRDVVKLGMGLIGTMTALVLGLLIASAKNSFDTQRNGLAQLSANIILLDRALSHFGAQNIAGGFLECRHLAKRGDVHGQEEVPEPGRTLVAVFQTGELLQEIPLLQRRGEHFDHRGIAIPLVAGELLAHAAHRRERSLACGQILEHTGSVGAAATL